MELSLILQPTDRVTVLPVGVPGAEPVVSISPIGGPARLAVMGAPSELRRLARALWEAAAGEEQR